MASKIYSIANQKGGVGKSTTTLNVSFALSDLGKRVLMVDLDPQAGLTISLGNDPETFSLTSYSLLRNNDVTAKDVILETSINNNLHFIPSNLDLSGAEVELISGPAWGSTLKYALEPIMNDYEYIFIDCPPSLGVLTVNGLIASNTVIVPVQAEYLAMRGLKLLIDIVKDLKKKANHTLEMKILRTMHTNTLHSAEVTGELKTHFGNTVFETIIKRSIKFADSTIAGKPIIIYAKDSDGSIAYRNLAQEILEYDKQKTNP
jgi:chromosome partitioning protein